MIKTENITYSYDNEDGNVSFVLNGIDLEIKKDGF